MIRSIFAALCALPLLSQPLRAADAKPHLGFDRDSAIRHALAENLDLAAARAAIGRAEARLAASGLRPNPTVEIEYADDFAFSDEGERSASLRFAQSFPLARRLEKEKSVSRVAIAKARQEVRLAELELIQTVAEFALEVQVLDTRAEHLKLLRQALAETGSFADEKVRSGELSSLDASQIQIELRVLDQELRETELNRERLIHQMAPRLGLHSADHFAFAADTELAYSERELPGYDPRILERHPAFQLAVLQTDAAAAEAKLAAAENWGAVTASLFWEEERSRDFPVGPTKDRLLGISISVPLPLRKKGQLLAAEHRAEQEQARLQARALAFSIENEVEHARHEAQISRESLSRYEAEVLRFADEQLDRLQQAYRSGQVDMLALLRAQQQRIQLENGYLELFEQYLRALLELELARLDFPQLP